MLTLDLIHASKWKKTAKLQQLFENVFPPISSDVLRVNIPTVVRARCTLSRCTLFPSMRDPGLTIQPIPDVVDGNWQRYYQSKRMTFLLPCDSKSSVRPSVCPSVTLMYRGHKSWVSLKVITRLESSLSQPQHPQFSPSPQNSGGIGLLSLFSAENLQYLEYWILIESCIPYALSFGTKINELGWPWTAITRSIAQNIHFVKPTTKIWMKIDPYYQERRCSAMTKVTIDD